MRIMDVQHHLASSSKSSDLGTTVVLEPVQDPADRREIPLKIDQHLIVGRASKTSPRQPTQSPANALFDCPVISRNHARIDFQSGYLDLRVSVTDTHSMHGTRVNEKKITPGHAHVLRDGDVIKFGNVVERSDVTHPPFEVRFSHKPYYKSLQPSAPSASRSEHPRSFKYPSSDEDSSDNEDYDGAEASSDAEEDMEPISAQTTPEKPKEAYGSQKQPIDLDCKIVPSAIIDLAQDDDVPAVSQPAASERVSALKAVVIPDSEEPTENTKPKANDAAKSSFGSSTYGTIPDSDLLDAEEEFDEEDYQPSEASHDCEAKIYDNFVDDEDEDEDGDGSPSISDLNEGEDDEPLPPGSDFFKLRETTASSAPADRVYSAPSMPVSDLSNPFVPEPLPPHLVRDFTGHSAGVGDTPPNVVRGFTGHGPGVNRQPYDPIRGSNSPHVIAMGRRPDSNGWINGNANTGHCQYQYYSSGQNMGGYSNNYPPPNVRDGYGSAWLPLPTTTYDFAQPFSGHGHPAPPQTTFSFSTVEGQYGATPPPPPNNTTNPAQSILRRIGPKASPFSSSAPSALIDQAAAPAKSDSRIKPMTDKISIDNIVNKDVAGSSAAVAAAAAASAAREQPTSSAPATTEEEETIALSPSGTKRKVDELEAQPAFLPPALFLSPPPTAAEASTATATVAASSDTVDDPAGAEQDNDKDPGARRPKRNLLCEAYESLCRFDAMKASIAAKSNEASASASASSSSERPAKKVKVDNSAARRIVPAPRRRGGNGNGGRGFTRRVLTNAGYLALGVVGTHLFYESPLYERLISWLG